MKIHAERGIKIMNDTTERRLNIEGAYNLRELGGYKNKEGKKLKYHKLLRSDHLHNITDEDAIYLQEYGLKTIVDFRSPEEYEKTLDKSFPNTEKVIILCIKQIKRRSL